MLIFVKKVIWVGDVKGGGCLKVVIVGGVVFDWGCFGWGLFFDVLVIVLIFYYFIVFVCIGMCFRCGFLFR